MHEPYYYRYIHRKFRMLNIVAWRSKYKVTYPRWFPKHPYCKSEDVRYNFIDFRYSIDGDVDYILYKVGKTDRRCIRHSLEEINKKWVEYRTIK